MKTWVICESPDLGAELVTGAKEMAASDVTVTAFTAGERAIAGADKTFLLPLPAAAPWESYLPVLLEKAQADAPELILVGASRRGRTLAAQLAALLDAPCVSDCRKLTIDGGVKTVERMIYGGLALKTLQTSASTVVAIVARGMYSAASGVAGDTETLSAPNGPIRVLERTAKAGNAVNLEEATRVVGVGRGFENKSELAIARDLCAALDANLACTRPIAEFFKWMPEECYLGISGQVIKPQLYMACGLSGQAQHVYGVRDAKVIVAINKDEHAPIMEHADYFIIGDVKAVLPVLSVALKN